VSDDLRAAVEHALRERWPAASLAPLGTMAGGRSVVTLVAGVSGAEVDRVVVKAARVGRPAQGRHAV
jgi:hypothetical protein